MKPSQLPSWHCHQPPSSRGLPYQGSELCHGVRLGPPRHPTNPPGPIHSSGFVLNCPTNIDSSVNRFHPMSRGRVGPLQQQHHQPPGSLCYNTASRPQPSPPSVICPAASQFMKDLSNHSPSSHIKRDQGTDSKAQSSDVRSPLHTMHPRRDSLSPSFCSRAVQDVHPDSQHWSPGNSQWGYQPSRSTQSSDRNLGSSLPIRHSPVAPCQEQLPKRTPSRENLIPVVDLNRTSQKRHREFKDHDGSPKRCPLAVNCGKAQTPKPTVGNLLSTPSTAARHSSVLELSPRTTDSCPCIEPACGQSTKLDLSSTLKPTQASCASPLLKTCIKNVSSMGVKPVYMNSTQCPSSNTILLRSATASPAESVTKISQEIDKRDKSSSLLSSEVPQKDTDGSAHVQSGSQNSGHTHQSTLNSLVKTPSRGNRMEERRKSGGSPPKQASKTISGSRTVERSKTARPRRPVAVPDDLDELFTPDPICVVSQKPVKPNMNGIRSTPSEKGCSSSTVASPSTPVTGSSCRKAATPHSEDTRVSSLSIAHHPEIISPTVALKRVKLEDFKSTKDRTVRNSPITSSGRQFKGESVTAGEKHTSPLPNNVRTCTSETSTTTSTSHCSVGRQASERHRKPVTEEDPIDMELDLGLSFALDMDLTQSSNSSEEEQLLSLQEMMKRVTKPLDTPEKRTFSEPSTPGHHSSQSKTQQLPSTTKLGNYKNNLDQMLKEIHTNKRAKEVETQLLTACKEDLLRITEYEEAEKYQEERISAEQQEFLKRYSLMSNAIKEVPPGEAVFSLERFGQIFNQDTLQLRQCRVNPQGTAQKILLWSSPAQFRLHVNIGLFQEAYNCHSPCPAQVSRFLFKMMSVHSERMLSERILQVLCDTACTAAYQIVKNGSQQFKVWVPSLANVVLVLMNMGVAFVTLFPFENLQPPFTEGDLLEDIYIKSESPSSNKEQSTFPEHNCNNILKYLSYCMGLCPRAYSDEELLLLLTVVGKVGLDTRFIHESSVELYPLQYKMINNIREWDTMLPRICLALADLTDDHHNMCLLVQRLPDNTRGKQLRQHLSLSMISKLLDGNCTYRPAGKEFQLSELRPYLARMQPSSLLRDMLSSSSRSRRDQEEEVVTLDQQAYYLCYSLLTLVNEASNFFLAHQKRQLLFLCSELETHVKCDIRESEKCLYRSKVKDLVARIYTKWQMLLQRTRPLHDKLYDYWQPLPVDTLTSSQEEQDLTCDGGEEDEEAQTNEDVMIIAEDEEKKEGDDTVEEAPEVRGESNQEMEPHLHEPMEAANMECTKMETENVVEGRETSHHS